MQQLKRHFSHSCSSGSGFVMLALVDSGQKKVKHNTPLDYAYSAPLAYLRILIHLTAVQTYTYIFDNTLPIPQSNATKAELDCA